MGNKMAWLKVSEYVPEDDFTVVYYNKWAGYFCACISVEDGEIAVRDMENRWLDSAGEGDMWTIIVGPRNDEGIELDPLEFAITPQEAIRRWNEEEGL
jgi:hypothetical protein